jgi:hypothetical protein
MSSTHTTTMKLAQLEATRKGWRMAINTIYRGWTGELVKQWPTKAGLMVELKRAAFRCFGLGTGTLDLVGWRPVRITADMVGQTIAQYVEVDAKTQGAARLRPEQKNRARVIREAGGFAGIAMRIEEAPGRVAIAEISEDL